MINKCFFQGRFVAKPELRYTSSQTPVCSFSLAIEDDYKKPNGERGTTFADFVAWNKSAEFISSHCDKGDMAIVLTKLQNQKWTDKNGNNRVSAEFVVENFWFGGSKRTFDTPAATEEAPAPAELEELDDADGELPF